ncbi:sensor domain-containing diguanylate cyclase [Stenotrophomonas sp. TWI1151]|uniref:GGDEF domain-containing protein n=1 Tax=Stenotrophomonas sp. TWI1151 TaxID=3136798 RepID=UPI003209D550
MTTSDSDALAALCQFARLASHADLVMAVEVDAGGRATWAVSAPALPSPSFNLARSGILEARWTGEAMDAADFRLPTAIIHALEGRPARLLYVPAPSHGAPLSGLLLLWRSPPAPAALTAQVPLLATSVARLLSARREAARGTIVRNQFLDLFESVPAGIVLIDGDGVGAAVNEHAAELLGCTAGNHRAADLAGPMRALRQRCDNHAELEVAYSAQMNNDQFAAKQNWTLGERTFEVDTHPVRGNGAHGRIWLFTDVTADLLMAAELRRLASSDPLTGVPNRRHFEECSVQIIAAREANGRAVAVLMVDVDHFKKINDTYGHPVGDEVLKVVAKRCRDALRERDLFARFGGEEFIALLAASAVDEIPAAAGRLRSAVAAEPILVGGERITVSVSVGGAIGEALPGGDQRLLEALIARADEALYDAKTSGRNRVRMAPLQADLINL